MSSTRSVFPAGHVVHMTLDHQFDPVISFSVATCDCGWSFRVIWPDHHAQQDTAIEAHWEKMEAT